ncbi:MAG: pyridinium-3,5-biscarboxylic acid mononucleotide synthase [Chloroflexota bacterium]|nr:pyridinium-3,5-biscarboxylic acid mononucleotide synthase [Chloroflexota bacterium]
MKEILERLLAGEFTVDEALRALDAEHVEVAGDLARLDPGRLRRKGVPEVIYAPGKTPAVTADLAARMVAASGQALVSRVDAEAALALETLATKNGWGITAFGSSRRLVAAASIGPEGPGGVGILAAGTSDVDVAEEARMVIEAMGVPSHHAYDVGVSALHRLEAPLRQMVSAGVDVFVVAAGMEAALPTLVAGLVAVPVIALPVSTGYGAGGRGLAALLSSLQTCSPGMTVVNIDNGIGAGAAAGLIAGRVAAARSGSAPAVAPPASRRS